MSAWKACDIRGPFPREVSPELFESVGQAFASWLPASARVLLAGDFRLSTPELKSALTRGLLRSGLQVLDAGQIPTPLAYFAHRTWETDAVLIVTASHNPPDHNGLKFMAGKLPPTEEQVAELRERTAFVNGPVRHGSIDSVDVIPLYTAWIHQRWSFLKNRPLRIVLDSGNGAWSELGPATFEGLGLSATRLFCEIDGRFPNRHPDCARSGNLGALKTAVLESGADLGIAWDGDGDRVAFIDRDGEFVTADEISLILIETFLKDHLPDRVVYDVKLSDAIPRAVEAHGAIALIERSGHTFLKRRMILDDCVLGCEASGHYFFRELHGGDDGLFAALLLASICEPNGGLQRFRHRLPNISATPDFRLPAADLTFSHLVDTLRRALNPLSEVTIDGTRFQTNDGFVLVRQSVTEPVITFRVEGFTKAGLNNLLQICGTTEPALRAAFREHGYLEEEEEEVHD